MTVRDPAQVAHEWRLRSVRPYRNAVETWRTIRARIVKPRPRPVSFSWKGWLAVYLACVVAGLVLLDPLVGDFVHNWPIWLALRAITFTDAGKGTWYIVPALAFLIVANLTDWRSLSRRWLMAFYSWTSLAFFVLWCTALSGLAANLLKLMIGRARPTLFDELGTYHFEPFTLDSLFRGFPSGHATVLGGAAALLMLLFPRFRWPILIFGAWVASTRIFVSAHYPADVIAGYGFGIGFAILGAVLMSRMGFMFTTGASGFPVSKPTFRLFWPLRQAGSYRLRVRQFVARPA
ncbi:phosphatase PAP2 family protein [Nitratireductor mangrovi]|uniref:Phosphatase PAP2 family protein n=1 Tax=Nitratireductor mangrovi TaxID=2599600 RepID=A0A5B8KZ27_9HYPH|nr:phosphatase PAP2 family protein [Nitratireductor mangrovi]QDZ00806.1 phosphatase PAP2 family protein [Nitratireductor mangrovi]